MISFRLDADDIREVIDAQNPDASDKAKDQAVDDVLSAAANLCLYSLAEHVVEQTGVEVDE